jgi:hypothetical protein
MRGVGGQGSHYLVIWFKIARKLSYTGFIIDSRVSD